MEDFMTQYSGEIVTALIMLVIMLVIVLYLFGRIIDKSPPATRHAGGATRHGQGQRWNRNTNFPQGGRPHGGNYNYNTRQSDAIWGFVMLIIVAMGLAALMFFFRDYVSIDINDGTAYYEGIQQSRHNTYPSIGINKQQSQYDVSHGLLEYEADGAIEVKEKIDADQQATLEPEVRVDDESLAEFHYSCQVSAFDEEHKAKDELVRWKARFGEDVYLAIGQKENGEVSYKVLIGPFKTKAEAATLAQRIGQGYARDQAALSAYRP